MSVTQDVAEEFDTFARLQHDRLLRLANRRLGDWHEAEEVAQETLLRAYQRWDTFDSPDGAAAWCTTVATRLVIDRVRVRPRAVVTDTLPEPRTLQRDAADVAAAREDAALALDVLGGMPQRQAAVLWARHVEGLSYDSIGRQLSMSEPTVRSLLHRARASLRTNFTRRGGELPVGAVLLPRLLRRALRPGRTALGQPAMLLAAAVAGISAALVLLPATPAPAAGPPTVTPRSALPAALPQRAAAPEARPAHAQPSSLSATPNEARTLGSVTAALPQQVCVGGSATSPCVSHEHLAHLPGASIVVRLPAPLSVAGYDRIGLSTSGIGSCPRLPVNPVASCAPGPNTSTLQGGHP